MHSPSSRGKKKCVLCLCAVHSQTPSLSNHQALRYYPSCQGGNSRQGLTHISRFLVPLSAASSKCPQSYSISFMRTVFSAEDWKWAAACDCNLWSSPVTHCWDSYCCLWLRLLWHSGVRAAMSKPCDWARNIYQAFKNNSKGKTKNYSVPKELSERYLNKKYNIFPAFIL